MVLRASKDIILEQRVISSEDLQLHPESLWKPRLPQKVRLMLICYDNRPDDYSVGLYRPRSEEPLGVFTTGVRHDWARRVYRKALKNLRAGQPLSFDRSPGKYSSGHNIIITAHPQL